MVRESKLSRLVLLGLTYKPNKIIYAFIFGTTKIGTGPLVRLG